MKSMPAEQVLRFLRLINESHIWACLDGGWGVDALLEEQTRPHSDLDLIINVEDASRLIELATRNGFHVLPDGSKSNFILADVDDHRVDVHAILFDERGFGVFQHPDGRRWPFPASAFSGQGSISGQPVRCLSPEAQVQCHGQGYEPTSKDIEDMTRLQERYGVILPLGLCRQE